MNEGSSALKQAIDALVSANQLAGAAKEITRSSIPASSDESLDKIRLDTAQYDAESNDIERELRMSEFDFVRDLVAPAAVGGAVYVLFSVMKGGGYARNRKRR